jgi:hypothetical protein
MTKPLDRARQLRTSLTDTERFVWSKLRNRRFARFKFRRQVPIGPYIVDFVCFDRRLIMNSMEVSTAKRLREDTMNGELCGWKIKDSELFVFGIMTRFATGIR